MAVTNAAAPNTTSSSSVREVHHTTGDNPAIAYTLYEPDAPISDLTLLLLHGAANDEWCWQYHWTAYLAQHGWRCLTLSYRAHGESAWSRPVQEASLDDDVADVNTVLAAEGLKSRHVIPVGHSLGRAIAQRLAAQQDVAGLIIIASLALGRWMREAFPKMPGQFIRHPRIYPKLVKDPTVEPEPLITLRIRGGLPVLVQAVA